MYRGLKVLAVVPCWDEAGKIGRVVRRVPRAVVDQLLVVDDGSADGSAEEARQAGATVLSVGRTRGVGAALREGYRHGLQGGFDVTVVVAGNDKDAPEEIPLLLEPIAAGAADLVQGSRWLRRDPDLGEMPRSRRLATRVHPLLFSLVARRWVTESTNGFRAVHRRVLADARVDLSPRWLDGYALEPHLYLRAIACGFRTVEVPVTKRYPPRALGQTKVAPVTGWWSLLEPLARAGLAAAIRGEAGPKGA